MEFENQSSMKSLTATPIKSTKDLFLGRFRNTGEKSAKTPLATVDQNSVATADQQLSEIQQVSSRGEQSDAGVESKEESIDEQEVAQHELLYKLQEVTLQLKQSQELNQHYEFENLTLKGSIEVMTKQHEKERRFIEQENTELRKRAQKAEEEKDAEKMDSHRRVINMEANFQTQINQMRAKLTHERTLANSGPHASMRSGRSFSMFSGRSQKVQAKAQANYTERDHARTIRNLQEELDKHVVEVWKLTEEQKQWIDIAAEKSGEIVALKEENQRLRERCSMLKEKLRRRHNKNKILAAEKEDLILKAGWAAEELQRLTAENEYEKSKHVKHSRLAYIKQTEENKRLQDENARLKSNTPVKDATDRPVNSAKKSASKSATVVIQTKEVAAVPDAEADIAPAPGSGTGYIAELIAHAARQRQRRNVPIEPPKKQPANPSKVATLADTFAKAIHDRRINMNEDSNLNSEEDSESSLGEDWKD